MCGIAGMLYADSSRPANRQLLQTMGAAIAHRGPDAEGIWSDAGVGLVHRRLSIIDIDGGDQPIGNEDGSIQVVFNGEIYNYRQLRDELIGKGHRLQTQSDTEVLVHLYEELGERLVEKLRGMFALALWDSNRRRLVLARDRIGLKPLYIYRDGEKLLFGSELKAILAHPQVDRTVDVEALEDYLTFGVIPGHRSIFRRVEKLPPAHVLVVTADHLNASPRRYWSYPTDATVSRSVEDWKSAIDDKIRETVSAHLIADVPVGAFLSGGIDSSLVVGIAAELSPGRLPTFSIGFREHAFSELPYARQVAEQFNCLHTEEIVTADAAADLDDLVTYFDEPFADSSAIPTLRVSRLARRSVKVVLSGDGGDEAFGGYRRYVHDLREARLRAAIPRWACRQLVGPLARAWPKADWLPKALRLKSTLTNLSLSPAEAYAHTLSICRLPWRRGLLSGEVRSMLNGHRPEREVIWHYENARGRDELTNMIAADVNLLLPDDFLTKVDRASMACGLEVRPPLVDHEFLELTAQVPSSLKVRNGHGKWILKEIIRNRLPEAIWNRPKQGFEIPVDEWLRSSLRSSFEDKVLSRRSTIVDLIDQRAVRKLYQSHQQGVGYHGNGLWSLLVLANWAAAYLSPTGEWVRPNSRSAALNEFSA
ncbi:MAG: asparagine synthase (glutamine-hydrolyzing) [Pirellulales bacterium]|nr:asparagine synthase (glutamine-hydrolyzing) [Pirellulales bacterium]